jgi:hypothetical protein
MASGKIGVVSDFEVFILGALAKLFATSLSYPLVLLKSRLVRALLLPLPLLPSCPSPPSLSIQTHVNCPSLSRSSSPFLSLSNSLIPPFRPPLPFLPALLYFLPPDLDLSNQTPTPIPLSPPPSSPSSRRKAPRVSTGASRPSSSSPSSPRAFSSWARRRSRRWSGRFVL